MLHRLTDEKTKMKDGGGWTESSSWGGKELNAGIKRSKTGFWCDHRTNRGFREKESGVAHRGPGEGGDGQWGKKKFRGSSQNRGDYLGKPTIRTGGTGEKK